MNEVNIPLLRKAVEWVEAEAAKPYGSRQWNQGDWVVPESHRVLALRHEPHCGTAYCVAGFVGQTVDARFADRDWVVGEDGYNLHVSKVAAEALGIEYCGAGSIDLEDGNRLFAGSNTAEDIRRIAEEIAGERL